MRYGDPVLSAFGGWSLVVVLGSWACTNPEDSPQDDGGGEEDAAAICTAGTMACDGFVLQRCTEDGMSWVTVETCAGACDPAAGCVDCRTGMHRCEGGVSRVCVSGGEWQELRDCRAWGSTCGDDGFCDDACAVPERNSDYRGCDTMAAALLNPQAPTTTVAIANPNDAEVHAEVLQGTIVLEELDIEAHWIRNVELEANSRTWSHVGTEGVVRVRSSLPVTVTQYLPFESASTWSADASLLLPVHAWGRRHRVVSYLPLSYVGLGVELDETHHAWHDVLSFARGFLTVVGSPHGGTRVTVTPAASLDLDPTGRVPAVAAGDTFTMELAPGEAVQLMAARHPLCDGSRPGFEAIGVVCREHYTGAECAAGDGWCDCRDDAACAEAAWDLTGTLVESDRPVAVFGGHECAFVPYNRWACDHLQDQMPPVASWGVDHVSMTVGPAGGGGPNLVRILADTDGTTVTIDPPQSGTGSLELDAGEWAEVVVDGIFHVTASHPILVAQYLWGQGMFLGPGLRGDPSLWIVPPVEQFRRNYDVLMPESYQSDVQGQNYLLVVRPLGKWTALDRVRMPDFAATVGGWEAGVVQATPGVLSVVGEQEFGLTAIGLSEYTSYATPAGRGFVPLLL
ncbi:MAG: IgGFc-binding protein [Deltaproteobacteria bacterium]|nr:IgGFc-binding protein [Deltaproteobacteria bacterium]